MPVLTRTNQPRLACDAAHGGYGKDDRGKKNSNPNTWVVDRRKGTECSKRCEYILKTGNRCRNIATHTGPFCWLHTMKVFGVRVKDAQFGKGLFAAQDFRKGQGIVPYNGGDQYSTEAKADKAIGGADELGHYMVKNVRTGAFQNPHQTNANVGRYANSVGGAVPSHKQNAELGFLTRRPTGTFESKVVWILATKNIKKGQEILVNYGDQYWENWDRDSVAENMEMLKALFRRLKLRNVSGTPKNRLDRGLRGRQRLELLWKQGKFPRNKSMTQFVDIRSIKNQRRQKQKLFSVFLNLQ